MKILQKITVFYLGFLSIVLPLKFASLTMMPEATSYFPEELWEYLIVNCPGTSTGMATGIGLLLSMLAFGQDFFQKKIYCNWSVVGWILAFIFSMAGFINASTFDYPLMATTHTAAFLSYALSIYIYSRTDENTIQKIFTWWATGLLLVMVSGLYQYFWGFDEQAAFYYSENGAAANIDNLDLSSKMSERRIFATFGSSNVLAGYLLLTGAIGFYTLYNLAGNFSPPKQSRIMLCGIFTAAIIFILINTGSRGAIAAVGGTLIYTLFWLDIKKQYKITGAALILLGACGLIAASVYFGRTFGSFTERLGYWRTAFLMMTENWYIGSGWGDFFVDNMRFRIIDLEETARGPHNLFLIFGCSCGLFAMLSVMFASLWGLFKASMKFYREKNLLNCAVMLSGAGFLIHAMLDVNFQIAASMGIFCTLTISAADDGKIEISKLCKFAFLLICTVMMVYTTLFSYNLTAGEKALDKLKTSIHMSLRENKFTEAQIFEQYNKVENCRPYSPFHVMDMYHYFFARRMYYDALPYLEKAIKRSPERAGYYYSRAFYMYTMSNNNDALKSIEKALKLYPNSQKYRQFEDFLKKSIKK